jgi:hypothetical protein
VPSPTGTTRAGKDDNPQRRATVKLISDEAALGTASLFGASTPFAPGFVGCNLPESARGPSSSFSVGFGAQIHLGSMAAFGREPPHLDSIALDVMEPTTRDMLRAGAGNGLNRTT